MSNTADLLTSGLLRASLVLTVSAILVALCVRGLKLTAPRAEQWAWLCVLLQGLLISPVLIPLPASWSPPAVASLPARSETPAVAATPEDVVGETTVAIAPSVSHHDAT